MSDEVVLSTSALRTDHSFALSPRGTITFPARLSLTLPVPHCRVLIARTSSKQATALAVEDPNGYHVVRLNYPDTADLGELTLITHGKLVVWSWEETGRVFEKLNIAAGIKDKESGSGARCLLSPGQSSDNTELALPQLGSAWDRAEKGIVKMAEATSALVSAGDLTWDDFSVLSVHVHAKQLNVSSAGPGRVLVLTRFPEIGANIKGADDPVGLALLHDESFYTPPSNIKIATDAGHAVVATYRSDGRASDVEYEGRSRTGNAWISALDRFSGPAEPGITQRHTLGRG